MFGYSNRINWESFTDLERTIIESLPHGSGIDGSWFCEKQKNGKVACYNAYHGMDEYGGYVGSVDFSFRFDANDPDSMRIMFHDLTSTEYRWVERWDLREYFNQIFYPVLDENITRDCPYCENGRREIRMLSSRLHETLEDTIARIEKNGYVVDLDNMTITCWVCRGTGKLPVKENETM